MRKLGFPLALATGLVVTNYIKSQKDPVDEKTTAISNVVGEIISRDNIALNQKAAERGISVMPDNSISQSLPDGSVGIDFLPYGNLDLFFKDGKPLGITDDSSNLERAYSANLRGLARETYPEIYGIIPLEN